MLDVRARKICSEIGSHNSRSESTKVVAKLKSNKPTKVKTKFEAIKFLLEIVKFVPGNYQLNHMMSIYVPLVSGVESSIFRVFISHVLSNFGCGSGF